jgi:hypothetical protein
MEEGGGALTLEVGGELDNILVRGSWGLGTTPTCTYVWWVVGD